MCWIVDIKISNICQRAASSKDAYLATKNKNKHILPSLKYSKYSDWLNGTTTIKAWPSHRFIPAASFGKEDWSIFKFPVKPGHGQSHLQGLLHTWGIRITVVLKASLLETMILLRIISVHYASVVNSSQLDRYITKLGSEKLISNVNTKVFCTA